MKATIAALWLMLLGLTASVHADTADNYLRSEMEKRHIPGLSVAVIQNGKVVKTQGYGAAKTETAYQLASLTKQFTAAAIIKLAQDGKFSVDDPIRRYLPNTPALWDTITIRELLNQDFGHPQLS